MSYTNPVQSMDQGIQTLVLLWIGCVINAASLPNVLEGTLNRMYWCQKVASFRRSVRVGLLQDRLNLHAVTVSMPQTRGAVTSNEWMYIGSVRRSHP